MIRQNNNYKNVVILIGIFLSSLVFLQPWVRGDGINYYAYIRSLVIDGDLQFGNEFKDAMELNKLTPPMLRGTKEYRPTENLGVPETLLPLTETGHIRNRMSVGTALLWSPFFLLAHLLVKILNVFGIKFSADGYSFPYLLLVSFGSSFYALIGLILAYKICRRYSLNNISLGATVAIWWASPLPAYMYGHPLLSHTGSIFVISVLLFLYLKIRENPSLTKWTIFGFLSGLATIVRLQDSTFLLLPGIEFLRQYYIKIKEREPSVIPSSIRKGIVFLIGFLLGILPQLIVGKIIYGRFALDFYHQMQDEKAWRWSLSSIFRILFSSCHGLFSWTPLLLLAVIGLYFFYKKDRILTLTLLVIFSIQLIVISGMYSKLTGHYIWEYSSFGGRMFLGFIPLFIFGLAALIDALKDKLRPGWFFLLGGGFILWNLGFILQFALGLIPREGYISWPEMIHNQLFVIPLLVYKKIGSQVLIISLISIIAIIFFHLILKQKRWTKLKGI